MSGSFKKSETLRFADYSYFYYMWNAWCKNECIFAFGGSPAGWEHFWQKWVGICERNKFNHFGAVEEFFADLGEYYQDLLVARAVKVYNRKERVWKQ